MIGKYDNSSDAKNGPRRPDTMSKIFISYRRTDSDITGRIADSIIAAFGQGSVFLDVDNIPVGQDFRVVIEEAIEGSDCVVIVIGVGWIRASEGQGTEEGNLNDGSDFVRLEVKSALNLKTPILPVLVGDVDMPDANALPEDIRELAFINATRVRSGRDFRLDMNYLIDSIRKHVDEPDSGDGGASAIATTSEDKGAPNASIQLGCDSPTLTDTPSQLVGKSIGRYRLKHLIATGGGGAVFTAVDSNLSREVFLKVAFPMRISMEKLTDIVARGVKGVVKMQHDGIVQILDFDSFELTDGARSFFLAMNEIKGPLLNEWVASLPNDESGFLERIECGLALSRTLQDAHDFSYVDEAGLECIGVLHGDIKPNNIIMSNGSPKLLDFMMIDLQEFRSQTIVETDLDDGTTRIFGTPTYMAPEQEYQGVVTRKSDVFGLGSSYRDLFSGVHSSDWSDGKRAELEANLERINALIAATRQMDPADRPGSMRSVADELEAIRNDVQAVMNDQKNRGDGNHGSLFSRLGRIFRSQ